MKIHIVKKGDSLYELSKKYGVPLVKIVDANPQLVDPNKLDIGTKVKIPTEPVSVPDASQPIIHKHAVKQGDSLWKLSKAWGVSLKEIIDANPQLKNPNALLVGEIVNIPSAGAFTNMDNGHHTGGHKPEKIVPGSKTYTGPKEKLTAPKEEVVIPKEEVNIPKEEANVPKEEINIPINDLITPMPNMPALPNIPIPPNMPIMPNIPIQPNIPMQPENVQKPEVKIIPEITIAPEITVKKEITIMPELIVKPEMPKLPPAEPICEKKTMKKHECPEKHFAPVQNPFPSIHKCPEQHHMPHPFGFHSPEFMLPLFPQITFPESPCGCKEHESPSHGWHEAHKMHAGENENLPDWINPAPYYPGVTEQPMMTEYPQINMAEPYNKGNMPLNPYPAPNEQHHHFNAHLPSMGIENMPMIPPCGCHSANQYVPSYEQGAAPPQGWGTMDSYNYSQHYSHLSPQPSLHHNPYHYGYEHYPMAPYGENQYSYPWHGENEVHPENAKLSKKGCGCHGRQNEEEVFYNNESAVDPARIDEQSLQAEPVDKETPEVKVSREERTKTKSKPAAKKSRKQSRKPIRTNPWIRG